MVQAVPLRCFQFGSVVCVSLSVPRLLFLVRDPLGVSIWSRMWPGICLHAPDLAQN